MLILSYIHHSGHRRTSMAIFVQSKIPSTRRISFGPHPFLLFLSPKKIQHVTADDVCSINTDTTDLCLHSHS
jgi:hypothetical protein